MDNVMDGLNNEETNSEITQIIDDSQNGQKDLENQDAITQTSSTTESFSNSSNECDIDSEFYSLNCTWEKTLSTFQPTLSLSTSGQRVDRISATSSASMHQVICTPAQALAHAPLQQSLIIPAHGAAEHQRILQEFRRLLQETLNIDIGQFLPSQAALAMPISSNSFSYQPLDFFIYSESEMQATFSNCLFYLQTSEEKAIGSSPTPPIDEFAIRIITPSGDLCNVNIEIDTNNPTRCQCTFFSLEPGIYTAEARLRVKNHIGGSPLKIYISRSYGSSDLRVFKSIEEEAEHFRRPLMREAWGLAFNPFRDEMYIADRKYSEIIIRTLKGETDSKFVRIETPGQVLPDALCKPTGIAFDCVWNRIVIADREHHRICFFTTNGRFLGSFGKMGYKNGEFQFPWGVAVSPRGDKIAVTDTDNGRVQVFDHTGIFLGLCSSPDVFLSGQPNYFGNLKGITFDTLGDNIYFTDAISNQVFMLSSDLTKKKSIQLFPSDMLKHPQGLAVDRVGNIIICDTGHNCVRVVTQNGVLLSTRAGIGYNNFDDGPLGVCILSDGAIAVVSKNEQLSIF